MTTESITSENQSENQITRLPIEEVYSDDDFNCRGKISFADVMELAKDIEDNGLFQPIIVRPLTTTRRNDLKVAGANVDKLKLAKYEVVAGFRRFTAHLFLLRQKKATTVDSIIREDLTDERKAALLNLTENTHRQDLSLLQETRGVAKLLTYGMTHNEIADKLNKSYGWVQVRVAMMMLPGEIQFEADAGMLNQANIRELAKLQRNNIDREGLMRIAKKMKEGNLSGKRREITAEKVEKKTEEKEKKEAKTKTQILELQSYLQKFYINHLPMRLLAWAAGEISDNEIYDDLDEYAIENEHLLRPHVQKYERPADVPF